MQDRRHAFESGGASGQREEVSRQVVDRIQGMDNGPGWLSFVAAVVVEICGRQRS